MMTIRAIEEDPIKAAITAALIVGLAIDWYQTRRFTAEGRSELNPFYGEHPSPAALNVAFGASIGFVILAYGRMPRWWLAAIAGAELNTVYWNHRMEQLS